MHIPKKYFHDRAVLLLLSINVFLTVAGSLLLLLRLDNPSNVYLIQYRSNVSVDNQQFGSVTQIVAFMLFAVFVLVFNTLLSMKIYHVRRHFSVVLLGLATVLLSFSMVVSNALLSTPAALQYLLSTVLVVGILFLIVVDRKR